MSVSAFEFESAGVSLPRRRNGDRRRKARLRELCEEVLASYRLAQGNDVIAEEEREEAKQILRNVAPPLR